MDSPGGQNDTTTSAKAGAPPSTLGAKRSSFMPMTPRNVKGSPDTDFARQVRDRNAALQPTKKFKTVVPRGVKYGAGYTDRAKARAEEEEAESADDKASRIKALEEQMKLGQISEATFEALRDEITGGDISSTHLIKGLDRKLLERVRRGEDVLGGSGGEGGGERPPDVEEELDKLGEKEVETVRKEKVDKKGSMAPPPSVAGVKRSRNEIMAELKAQRKAAAEARAAPLLDNRWRRIGEEKSRVTIDHKGREVLITVDEDGVVKKKVRKLPATGKEEEKAALDMPDENRPILGADAVMPGLQRPTDMEDEEDDDIFEGVGTSYDPLGNDDDDDTDDDSNDSGDEETAKPERPATGEITKNRPVEQEPEITEERTEERPNNVPKAAPRNYFKDTTSGTEEPTQDRLAGVQELLKKAARMDSSNSNEADAGEDDTAEDREARLMKRAQMLAQSDRDFEDMDMGFGSNRFEDGEEDEDGKKVKLSEWKGSASAADDDGFSGGKGDGSKKKQRKPKKRKGDANSMADIMGVIEKRKSGDGRSEYNIT